MQNLNSAARPPRSTAGLPRPAPRVPSETSQQKTILIADDEPSLCDSLSAVLQSENYLVATAADGLEALDRLCREHIDLVLLDLNMPNLNGWDALDRLTSLAPLLPVVIITAKPDQEDRAEALGADALMEKPLDLPSLLHLIERLVSESPECRFNRFGRAAQRIRKIRRHYVDWTETSPLNE